MKCMYAQTRPQFILSSEGVLGGMEFEPMLTPRERSPLPKMSPVEDRTRDAVDSEPKHYQLSYSSPLWCYDSSFCQFYDCVIIPGFASFILFFYCSWFCKFFSCFIIPSFVLLFLVLQVLWLFYYLWFCKFYGCFTICGFASFMVVLLFLVFRLSHRLPVV